MRTAPTPLLIGLVAMLAPLSLALGVIAPVYWTFGLYALALLLCAALADVSIARVRSVAASVSAPETIGVGEPFLADVHVQFPTRVRVHQPRMALGVNALLENGLLHQAPLVMDGIDGRATLNFTPLRRGQAMIESLWIRWTGPLGLMALQHKYSLDCAVKVLPDTRLVRTEGVRLFQRDSLHGLQLQLQRGEGSDFDALTEYRTGMDRRAIDWKQSARHSDLLAKEFRTERDNRIVFAVDCGRAMTEPLEGVPRVDRAVSAALLAAWSALKLGDRVSLYAFDSRPRLQSAELIGEDKFALLQHQASKIDYSSEETNHILGLSHLSQQLTRRSLIILFTDFTDPTGAQLMVRAVGWLLARHVVLFVIFREVGLYEMMDAAPYDLDVVARAVTAAALLHEQRKVILQLKRMGLEVLETDYESMGLKLVEHYFDLKRRGRL